MQNNINLIAVVIITFLISFTTSLLLEIQLFKNPVRYILVVLLIIVQLYFGFLTYKYLVSKK